MKFQKFYIYFCSFSWLAWLLSILIIEIWGYTPIIYILTIVPFILGLTPTHAVLSVIALVKSIKRKKVTYIIFNILSMIVTLLLGFMDFAYCVICYTGGV